MKRRTSKDARYAPNKRVYRIWLRRWRKRHLTRLERREGRAETRRAVGEAEQDEGPAQSG